MRKGSLRSNIVFEKEVPFHKLDLETSELDFAVSKSSIGKHTTLCARVFFFSQLRRPIELKFPGLLFYAWWDRPSEKNGLCQLPIVSSVFSVYTSWFGYNFNRFWKLHISLHGFKMNTVANGKNCWLWWYFLPNEAHYSSVISFLYYQCLFFFYTRAMDDRKTWLCDFYFQIFISIFSLLRYLAWIFFFKAPFFYASIRHMKPSSVAWEEPSAPTRKLPDSRSHSVCIIRCRCPGQNSSWT